MLFPAAHHVRIAPLSHWLSPISPFCLLFAQNLQNVYKKSVCVWERERDGGVGRWAPGDIGWSPLVLVAGTVCNRRMGRAASSRQPGCLWWLRTSEPLSHSSFILWGSPNSKCKCFLFLKDISSWSVVSMTVTVLRSLEEGRALS